MKLPARSGHWWIDILRRPVPWTTPTAALQVQRTDWIDRAKGIGILLVVLGHSTQYFYTDKVALALTGLIYSFHMPLFFVLSGVFAERSLEKRGTAVFVTDKIRTIVYPYVIWSIFEGVYRYVLGKTTGFTDFQGPRQIAAIYYKPIYHYWFLYALAVSFFVFAAIYRLPQRVKPIAVISALSATAFVLSGLMPHSIVRQIAESFIYFVVGIHLSRALALSSQSNSAPGIVAGLGPLFILGNVLSYCGLAPDAPRTIQVLAFAAIGIGFTSIVAATIPGTSAIGSRLTYLGRISMAIYIFHIPPMAIAKFLMDSHGITDLLPHLLLECSLGIAIPTLIYRYVEPRVPRLYQWHKSSHGAA
jgi:fucose 4-O-acetylase-like acetyltransferase